MSFRLELAIWSRDTGLQIPCLVSATRVTKAASLYKPIICSMAAMLRDSVPIRASAPTSNTAAHDNHEKISSWVSFSLYGYGAPPGGPSGRRSTAIKQKPYSGNDGISGRNFKWPKYKVKALGVWFSVDPEKQQQSEWKPG